MTLWEEGDSFDEISLRALFAGEDPSEAKPAFDDIDEIAFLVCREGWPYVHANKTKAALRRAFS